MDNFRIKIRDFFNEKWLKSEKKNHEFRLSNNLNYLKREYSRCFCTEMSGSQLIEFLIDNELEKINKLPNYLGDYSSSKITNLKDEYKLNKVE